MNEFHLLFSVCAVIILNKYLSQHTNYYYENSYLCLRTYTDNCTFQNLYFESKKKEKKKL